MKKKENKIEISKPAKFSVKQAWITEKAANLASLNKYVFLVDENFNKPETTKAIESIYGVKVAAVNIINKKGGVKRLGRTVGKVPGHKKAIVTLKEGHKIDIMPTIE